MAKTNVTKEQWLEEGLSRFGRNGLTGLNVEQMAKKLGTSKGGFYWYFKSREEFIEALFGYWHTEETLAAIKIAEKQSKPVERLKALFLAPVQMKIYRDVLFQIRNLAALDKSYRQLLKNVENQRIQFITGIFVEMGIDTTKAESMGQFLYCYYLGWYERIKNQRITQKELTRQFDLVTIFFDLRGPK